MTGLRNHCNVSFIFNFPCVILSVSSSAHTGHKRSLDVATVLQGETRFFSVLMLTWGMHTNNCAVILDIGYLVLALAFISLFLLYVCYWILLELASSIVKVILINGQLFFQVWWQILTLSLRSTAGWEVLV